MTSYILLSIFKCLEIKKAHFKTRRIPGSNDITKTLSTQKTKVVVVVVVVEEEEEEEEELLELEQHSR